jgi:hypothetical protein
MALQDKLAEYDSRIKTQARKIQLLEITEKKMRFGAIESAKLAQQKESESRKKLRQLEMLVQESDRRFRQKEQVAAKLAGKLRSLAERERVVQTTHKVALNGLRSQGVASPKVQRRGVNEDLAVSLEAALAEKARVDDENKGLVRQVHTLAATLRDEENRRLLDEKERPQGQAGQGGKSEEDKRPPNGVAREMYDKIKTLQRHNEQLSHKLEVASRQLDKSTSNEAMQKMRASELSEALENAQLELSSRPTLKSWKLKLSEMQRLEEKLHGK